MVQLFRVKLSVREKEKNAAFQTVEKNIVSKNMPFGGISGRNYFGSACAAEFWCIDTQVHNTTK